MDSRFFFFEGSQESFVVQVCLSPRATCGAIRSFAGSTVFLFWKVLEENLASSFLCSLVHHFASSEGVHGLLDCALFFQIEGSEEILVFPTSFLSPALCLALSGLCRVVKGV